MELATDIELAPDHETELAEMELSDVMNGLLELRRREKRLKTLVDEARNLLSRWEKADGRLREEAKRKFDHLGMQPGGKRSKVETDMGSLSYQAGRGRAELMGSIEDVDSMYVRTKVVKELDAEACRETFERGGRVAGVRWVVEPYVLLRERAKAKLVELEGEIRGLLPAKQEEKS